MNKLEQAAEKSVNRNFLELHEADARVRAFIDGAKYMESELMSVIEEMRDFICNIETQSACSWCEKNHEAHIKTLESVNQKLKEIKGE